MNRRQVLKSLAVVAFAPLSLSLVDEFAPDYYIWGEGSPQPNWSEYIGRLVGKGICYSGNDAIPCYHIMFSDNICGNVASVEEKRFLRARKATWEEVRAAVKREEGTMFGVNPHFLGG